MCGEAGGGRENGGRMECRENGGRREGGRAVSCAREETPHQSYRLGPNTLSLLLCIPIVCTLSIV